MRKVSVEDGSRLRTAVAVTGKPRKHKEYATARLQWIRVHNVANDVRMRLGVD